MHSSGGTVSTPRVPRPHVARRHGFRDALATSRPRAPAGPATAGRPRRAWRSSSGLVRLHEQARASGERSVQQHTSCGARMRRAHRMAGKMSVPRRPSALLRHRHAARCQHCPLVQAPQRAAAAAACEKSGACATWWTAATVDGRPRGRWSSTLFSHHFEGCCCEQRVDLENPATLPDARMRARAGVRERWCEARELWPSSVFG